MGINKKNGGVKTPFKTINNDTVTRFKKGVKRNRANTTTASNV